MGRESEKKGGKEANSRAYQPTNEKKKKKKSRHGGSSLVQEIYAQIKHLELTPPWKPRKGKFDNLQ